MLYCILKLTTNTCTNYAIMVRHSTKLWTKIDIRCWYGKWYTNLHDSSLRMATKLVEAVDFDLKLNVHQMQIEVHPKKVIMLTNMYL